MSRFARHGFLKVAFNPCVEVAMRTMKVKKRVIVVTVLCFDEVRA